MSVKHNLEKRIALVRYLVESRTDAEIERAIGYEKRSVVRITNMLNGKGVNIQSDPNERTGRHYWLAMDLESALSIVNPERKKPGRKDGSSDNKENQGIWFIITHERRGAYQRIEELRGAGYAKH